MYLSFSGSLLETVIPPDISSRSEELFCFAETAEDCFHSPKAFKRD
jgi:hypothetical protein